MIKKTAQVALLGLALLLCAPAAAEEIIYFKSGQSLPIRNHVIKDGTVQVDLGDNGFMAFPMDLVDKIERAGSGVIVNQSGKPKNQMLDVPEDTSASLPVQVRRPAQGNDEWQQQQRAQAPATPVVPDEHGLPSIKPFGSTNGFGKSRFNVVGSQAAMNGNAAPQEGSMNAPRRIGNNGETRPRPIGLQKRSAAPPPPPPMDGATPDPNAGNNNDSNADQP